MCKKQKNSQSVNKLRIHEKLVWNANNNYCQNLMMRKCKIRLTDILDCQRKEQQAKIFGETVKVTKYSMSNEAIR